jgi:hypothetical protein
MYSDAVSKIRETNVIETTNGVNGFRPQQIGSEPEVFEKWRDWHPSQISHHGRPCCEIAREWVSATDFSELGGGSVLTGPRWLRQRFNWGASSFPIYWCEAVRKTTLDCGALAALAHEVFTVRGVRSYRVQLVQRFSHVATSQWSCSWSENGDSELRWIDRDLIYHEGCAVAPDEAAAGGGGGSEIKVWDASAGWWVDPRGTGDGYGSLLAIRLCAPNAADANRVFQWGTHRVAVNRWQKMS